MYRKSIIATLNGAKVGIIDFGQNCRRQRRHSNKGGFLDAAYIFGHTGNLSAALGSGWSVEDGFAWAIGGESDLTLPSPGDGPACVLRLDVHPALFPPKVPRQRLMIRAGKTVLGSFELITRQTLTIPLPEELTRGTTHLDLTFIHPDAVRPRDHLQVDDGRRLAICFHSAAIARQRPDGPATPSATHQSGPEPIHGVIAGGSAALLIREVIGKLPSLVRRLHLRFVDLSQPLDVAAERLRPKTSGAMHLSWLELNAGTPATREQLHQILGAAGAVRTFYAPIIRSFWPFQGPDGRAVAEPGHYHPSRYPYGDRLAQALAGTNAPDDALYTMYDMAAEQEPLELDEIYTNDLRRWRAEGRKSDMRLGDFIERHINTSRLFLAPNLPGPMLLREMLDQVLRDDVISALTSQETLAAELDTLLDGYAGWQQELPVHKRIASHFNLSWWSPDMKYRWMNNWYTHQEYILDYIKWVQWRP
jgi:hypothetical protein